MPELPPRLRSFDTTVLFQAALLGALIIVAALVFSWSRGEEIERAQSRTSSAGGALRAQLVTLDTAQRAHKKQHGRYNDLLGGAAGGISVTVTVSQNLT